MNELGENVKTREYSYHLACVHSNEHVAYKLVLCCLTFKHLAKIGEMARKVEVESEYGFDLENRDPLDKNPHVRVSALFQLLKT